MFLVAMFEVVGVASIMPFMAVLANSSVVTENLYLIFIYDFFGFQNVDNFLILLGIFFLFMLLISLMLKATSNYLLFRFVLMRELSINKRLIYTYLSQKYEWHLYKNSTNFGRTLLQEVNHVLVNALIPIMNVIAQCLLIVLILLLIFVINVKLAFFILGTMAIAYTVLSKVTGKFLSRIGNARLAANDQRFKITNELFGAIKDVKLAGLETKFISKFEIPSEIYARHQASSMVVAQLPRFGLEALAFGGILGATLYFVASDERIDKILPTLTIYAFAAYKLMPAVQGIYSGIAQLTYSGPTIDTILKDLQSLENKEFKLFKNDDNHENLSFNKNIEIKNMSFKYDRTERMILRDINYKIKRGNKIGIVGVSGSGKSTFLDIILGLLEPTSGSVLIDGHTMTQENSRTWGKRVGYVPQDIFLTDSSILENIAFGLEKSEIDFSAAVNAAKQASLHSFIINELPQKYETIIGERGGRISGGQRQRIGLARALYHNPDVLVLDEATSALDNSTEKSVMDTVLNEQKRTLIIVAHRLSTIKTCDEIIFLNDGVIASTGTFDDLLKNKEFKNMLSTDKLTDSIYSI